MSLDEATLQSLFDRAQRSNPDGMKFTPEESDRFRKSFEDPEFRKLFAEYMDELQDPKNREETESYISQLEGEQKVPEGKELIRPEPAFVAKSFKVFKKDDSKEKIFLNIVQSNKIDLPSKSTTPQGTCWSVPYSLGPPHMEKDKTGANAPCFDCCFHPEAIQLGKLHKEFKDLLVTTAMEGVERLYKQQGQDVSIQREFHIVKGIDYKAGQVPTMMIATANKQNWKKEEQKAPAAKKSPAKAAAAAKAEHQAPPQPPQPAAAPVPPQAPSAASAAVAAPKTSAASAGPAIKKGFLNNTKAEIYGDKLTTLRPANKREGSAAAAAASNISLVDKGDNDRSTVGDLNVPTSATTAKKGKGAAGGLIQEVKPGEQSASSAPTGTNTAASKPATRSDATGMKAVSTTKRAVPTPTIDANASSAMLHSPSGHRDVAVTSPSGSDVADADFAASPDAHGKPTATTTTSTDSALAAGVEVPKYTVKERGHISMGDFENMNAMARSNRPSELVYRIELPKITKASAIVLDIAERQLNLSYPDVYSLVVKLPYPVFDVKGTAKYDKASKSLTVTLPVRPPAAQPISVAPSTPTKAAPDSAAVQEMESDGAQSTVSPAKSTPAKKTASAGHSRWVGGSAPDTGASAGQAAADVEAETPLSLHEQIKRQAEAALQEAQRAAAAQPAKQTPAPATPAPQPAAAAAKAEVAVVQDTGAPFLPAAAFAGRKAGYVFKRGDLGVGYYLDSKQNKVTTASPAASKSESAAAAADVASVKKVEASTPSGGAELDVFPYECRQTKHAIAVIVQVRNIDPASVDISFTQYAVHIRFRAFMDGEAGGINAKSYGAVLRLTEAQCADGLDQEKCRYDAAIQNMAIVLSKRTARYWSAGPGTTSAHSESKSGELDEDAMKLVQCYPYVAPPVRTVAVAATNAAQVSGGQAPAPATEKAVSAEEVKVAKALESAMQSLQFSSSEALFELD